MMPKKQKYRVPFGTITVTDDAKEIINEILETKWLTRGKYVEEFENTFAKLFVEDVKSYTRPHFGKPYR